MNLQFSWTTTKLLETYSRIVLLSRLSSPEDVLRGSPHGGSPPELLAQEEKGGRPGHCQYAYGDGRHESCYGGIFSNRFECSFTSSALVSSVVIHLLHSFRVCFQVGRRTGTAKMTAAERRHLEREEFEEENMTR